MSDSTISPSPVPRCFVASTHLDADGKVYCDQKTRRMPLFQSWLAENRHLGLPMEVVVIDLDEVVRMQRDGAAAMKLAPEEDMVVREQAIDLIRDAAALRASDIHILRREKFTEIQFRINGKLVVAGHLGADDGDSLIRSIYQGVATTRDAQFNPRENQNAQISGVPLAQTGLTSVRIVRGPCAPEDAGGNFAVLRLQYGEAHPQSLSRTVKRTLKQPRKPPGILKLSAMGFSDAQVAKLLYLASAPEGAIILTGPTGSGKTTTIYELMLELARRRPGKRQVTIEDPVEYPMAWAVQLNVTNAKNAELSGKAFAERLRVGLRMDPDIMLIGEVRDAEVALSLINASLTGHLVTSTLHVTDPFQFVERLESMDRTRLPPKSFCDPNTVRGVIAQRLVPLLCGHCAKPFSDCPSVDPLTVAAIETYGATERMRVQGDGCAKCGFSGIAGRRAVAEIVITDDALMVDFVDHGVPYARARYRRRPDADPTMLEAAVALALQGLVDPSDIASSVNHITPKLEDRTEAPGLELRR